MGSPLYVGTQSALHPLDNVVICYDIQLWQVTFYGTTL
jgi:hypothetical protein